MSAGFKKLLIIRFVAYFAVFLGIFSLFFQFGPLISAEATYRKDQLLGVKHTLVNPVITSSGLSSSPKNENNPTSRFGSLIGGTSTSIIPVSTDFGIVIEKINANAKVIPDINPADERSYANALAQGVAEAAGSTRPGQPGNLFIFSHSADAPWNITRFNAIFYLLRELEVGDRISIFYQGRRYDYEVFDKQVVAPSDVSFLQNKYDVPVLTLQTCDPPGTLNHRLIVLAKLVGS